jgi:hypothetical protein
VPAFTCVCILYVTDDVDEGESKYMPTFGTLDIVNSFDPEVPHNAVVAETLLLAASPINIVVLFLTKNVDIWKFSILVLTLNIINILFDELDGVIDTDKPVISVAEVLAVLNVSVFVVLTTCNILPAGNPVLLALVNTVPLVAGNVSVVVPDTAGDSSVTEPEVEPLSISLAIS